MKKYIVTYKVVYPITGTKHVTTVVKSDSKDGVEAALKLKLGSNILSLTITDIKET